MAGLIWVYSSCLLDQVQVFSRGLTPVTFQSSQNSPFVRDRLTICVMAGRQASSICLRVLLGMMSSLQCLSFIFIMTAHTSDSMSGQKDVNFGLLYCKATYGGVSINDSLIFFILDRKYLVKSSVSSSSVLLGCKRFCAVLPISLLTRRKGSLALFLQSSILLLIDCCLK